ncbi:MAG: ABC transporter ATP-binding protein [Candidatus Fonsibacter sp.]|nr:ABC transporter ATP-binding protein [Candidatus Fonsibacter sp.]
MNLLELNFVSKKFGGFTAVDNVSLKINRGDIRFIIGPNGAGKSTLFKMIIGVHNLNSGQVLFNNQNIEKLSLNERINLGIGVKFQAPSVFSELTVKENLILAIKSKFNDEIFSFLEKFGLEKDQDVLAGDLSHGKKQWLDIALSTISRPELVFLDEPTAGLSFEETKKTGKIIQDLNGEGVTFVIVEHNMEILKQIAKSVSVLHLGKLFFEGSPKEVLSNKEVTNIYLGIL